MNAISTPTDPDREPRRELLSALYDGEASALDGGCTAWRDDAGARATWHTYHLIGDVLRSEDLASTPARDAAFLSALRTRLASEPVLLAPAPAATARRQSWLLPAAAAAGFVAVAGVLVVLRMGAPGAPTASVVAGVQPAASMTLTSLGAAAPAAPAAYVGQMIRDPQLDRYLQAHRGALVGGAVAVPGGVPRNLEVIAPVTPAVAPVAR